MNESLIQDAFRIENNQRYKFILPNMQPRKWLENDLMCVTEANIWNEFEIKLSRSDFKADQDKVVEWGMHRAEAREDDAPFLHGFQYGHYSRYKAPKHKLLETGHRIAPQRFWFIVPMGMFTVEEIPAWAGVVEFSVPSSSRKTQRTQLGDSVKFAWAREAPRLHSHKISNDDLNDCVRRMYYRYWDLRHRFVMFQERSKVENT